jgi:flagellar biosynthesis/type III secretory pathway protein FliH
MSALIRHETLTHGAGIRDYGVPRSGHARAPEQIETAADAGNSPELVALEREVARLRRQLQDNEESQREALKNAVTEAVDEARRGFSRDEAAALKILEEGVRDAAARMRDRLSSLDSLALVMCETVLEKLLGEGGHSQDLLTRAITAQMTGLRRQTVLAIHVSATDFPNDGALQKLRGAIGDARIEPKTDLALARGECRIDVRLGHIELSLTRHWQAIGAELRRMAQTGGAP